MFHDLRSTGFNQRVPMVCVIVEGGPAIVSTVLDYVSNNPPVPVFVFEGSGRAADLFAFLHKHTDSDRYAHFVFCIWWKISGLVCKNAFLVFVSEIDHKHSKSHKSTFNVF